MTDARLLARHLLWASTAPQAAHEGFNVVDGDVFRWSWMWGRLASAWHTDADLGRPIEVVTAMSKSRRLGFLDYQATGDAFTDLFGRLRADRLIPRRRPCHALTNRIVTQFKDSEIE